MSITCWAECLKSQQQPVQPNSSQDLVNHVINCPRCNGTGLTSGKDWIKYYKVIYGAQQQRIYALEQALIAVKAAANLVYIEE